MIYEIVRAGGVDLPDEPEGKVRWAAGAKDGVLLMHTAMETPFDEAEAVVAAISTYVDDPDTWDSLYGRLRETRALPVLDHVVTRIQGRGSIRELGRRLATTSADREPVKFGLALLGLAGNESDVEIVRTLAAHEEFTLPGLVALARLVEDAETAWWELARQVRGWGRIHLVHRLAGSERPEIRRWILVEGYRNDVMDEYLALIAAETGGLADELAADPDDELLDAACGIVVALLDKGSPAGDVHDYADGVRAVTNLLAQLEKRPSNPARLAAVQELRDFLSEEPEGWPAELAATCGRIVDAAA
ncbi:hypothetical protein [Kutzneria chonburiensis]|uniref:HEAT repeat domain-containing protein n=1 Tax=Kutzneria chonburiensis TaxID=1483604 RepID=A0ABV6MP42_9PSEU|nr:hypothetical protein [Kutzneria chonburiensis]